MIINKIGSDHVFEGKNCQDAAIQKDDYKIVCDGCSEGTHTEVGAWLFTKLFLNDKKCIDATIVDMKYLFGLDRQTVKDYLCFTTLIVNEDIQENGENYFHVTYCGDGYIILQKQDSSIEFVKIDNGDYPEYPIYNHIPKEWLGNHYQNGVKIQWESYDMEEYKNVGVASDGIRYILSAEEDLKNEFIEILKSGKEVKMKRFINKHQDIFKDDVSIVF